MNHFGAQAHIDIQNKVENSVQNCLTVLKANKNGSLHQNWIIHLLSAFEVFLPKFVCSKSLLSNLLP